MRIPSILACAVVPLLTCCGYLEDGRGVITVESECMERISSIEVEVDGVSSIKAGPLDPGSEFLMEFTVRRDSSYRIQVEFPSGRKLSKTFGYLTAGMGTWHRVVVEESGIEVVDSSHSIPSRQLLIPDE